MKVRSASIRNALLLMVLALGKSLYAQTAVTTSGGTTNTIPVFTGTSMIGNSPLVLNTSLGFIGIGYQGTPLMQVTPSLYNYFFAGSGNTTMTGGINVGFGPNAFAQNTTGASNVAVGESALSSNTSGNESVAFGRHALAFSTTPSYNTAVGTYAAELNTTGIGNTAIGQASLRANTTGSENSVFGHIGMPNLDGGYYNTAIGSGTLVSLQSGNSNTALGANALSGLTSGIDNVAVGDGAGDDQSGPASNTSANQSIYLGASSMSLQSGDSNEIVIGAYATGAGSNTVTLGNTNITSTILRGQVGIGTPAPAATLDVNGTIRIASLGANNPNPICTGANGILTTSGCSSSSGSPILTQSNGNAQVSGVLQVTGNTNPNTSSQGAYIGWNALTTGTGEMDFINNQGLGTGGFAFFNTTVAPNAPRTLLVNITGSGNVGIGVQNPGADLASLPSPPAATTPILEVNGDIALTQGHGGQMIYPDGTVQATAWNGTTLGGDYAEAVDVQGDRAQYAVGDVIVIDDHADGKFNKSSKSYSRMVAGVYSTKPGLVGRRTTADRPNKDAEVPMAMMGIAPVKVSTENGPIERGDLLVSSSTPGYAMKGTDGTRMMGAVIGKALAPLTSGSGLIEALISLQ